jgi:hypothetical protein
MNERDTLAGSGDSCSNTNDSDQHNLTSFNADRPQLSRRSVRASGVAGRGSNAWSPNATRTWGLQEDGATFTLVDDAKTARGFLGGMRDSHGERLPERV